MGCKVSVPNKTFYTRDLHNGHRYYATIESEYFSKGMCRYAFKGILHGKGPDNKKECVVKVFQEKSSAQLADLREDINASAKAKSFADEFNGTLRYFGLKMAVDFVQPFIATIKELAGIKTCGLCLNETDQSYFKRNEYVSIEPFIPGHYDKFTNNTGYEKEGHPVMAAFCHWTWHRSEGKYMVCDLQGVKSGSKYILTDPAIHSTDEKIKFGGTDLGVNGMVLVLNAHICNTVCQKLGLLNPYNRYRNRFSFEVNKKRSKVYRSQLSKVDIINVQRLIAIRQPIPEPIQIVILPVILEEDNFHTMENVTEEVCISVESKQNLAAPRLNDTRKQMPVTFPRTVLAEEYVNRKNKPYLTVIRENSPDGIDIRQNRLDDTVITEKKPDVKTSLQNPNKNAGKLVCVGGPICNDWPLPCNFYCNHCLTGAAMINDNKWTFS